MMIGFWKERKMMIGCRVQYLDDEGVEHGVFHAADVEVEDFERLPLEDGDDLDHLTRDALGERPQKHVGAGKLGLDIRDGGVAAGAELLDRVGAAGRR